MRRPAPLFHHEAHLTRSRPFLHAFGAALLLAGLGGARAPGVDFPPPGLDRAGLAAWIKSHTDLPPSNVAMTGPVHVVAVIPIGGVPGPTRKAVVEGEVIDREWASRHQLVSWRTDVEVDCASSKVKSPSGRSYPERKRKGEASAVFASADWSSPQPGDPIFGVVRALCAGDFQWPLRKAAPARPAIVVANHAPRASAPVAPPDAPIRTAMRVVEPPPPAALVIVEAPPPEPAFTPPAARRAPIPSKPAVRLATATTGSTRRSPAATATPGAMRGNFAVQVMASSTESRARGELTTLARVFSSETRGLRLAVTPANIKGKIYYRAMFTGLESAPRAQTLCQAISRLGYDCIVRKI